MFLQAPQRAGLNSYREVQVAPNGMLQEIAVEVSGKKRISGGSGGSRARTNVDMGNKVWTAELAVPMDGNGAGDGWRLNLFRVEGRDGAARERVYSAWSPTGTGGGKPDFHVPAAFGRLLDA